MKPSSSSRRSFSVCWIPSMFDFVGCDSSMSQPAKMSPILPTPCTVVPASRIERQVVRAPRLEREVVPVRRAHVVPRRARERARDHAADRVLAREELARDLAACVELVERHRVLVRGDLEDRVRGGVDDPLARLLVLLAELLDDLRPGGGLVAEHAARRSVHEGVDHVVREAVRVGRERPGRSRRPSAPSGRSSCPCPSSARAAGRRRRARPAAAGSPRAARRSRGRAPPGSADRGRRPLSRRSRGCSSPRRRTRRRPAARRLPPRRGRSRRLLSLALRHRAILGSA